MLYRLAARLVSLAILLTSVTACTSSLTSKNLEQAFAPDPRLKDNPATLGSTDSSQPNNTTVQLPAKVPTPKATPTPQPSASSSTSSVSSPTVTATQPSQTPESQPSPTVTATQPSQTPESQPSPTVTATQPSQTPESQPSPTSKDSNFTDLNQVPQEYRQYVIDLAELDALPLNPTDKSNKSTTGTQFNPNKIISRREYARWLFTANNIMHFATPAQQIHAASPTDRPAFQDVPATDPDFPIIQGLAEAGLVPSSLSGDSVVVLFRPDAPLTREQMILQKVPLDTHQALPNASVDAVKQTWGFQDAGRIGPLALKAVLADFQNGDRSNIRRVFGYTTLFQPQKPVERAEAAACLWFFGTQSEGLSAKDVLKIKGQQNQPSTMSPSPTNSANS